MSIHHQNYFSNSELEAKLLQLQSRFPSLCFLSELGRSSEGRPIWLITLGNRATGDPDERPALWADGNLHATEISGTSVLVQLCESLLSRYEEGDGQSKRILDSSTIYVAPRLCPDGAERVFREKPELLRSGTRSYPYEDTGEGLHIEDVDGDGRILQMRIPDPNGDWKKSSLHPELMEKRSPHEHGETYYRLLPEGRLKEYDGFQVRLARPKSYLDFNRNFPYHWRGEGEQSGAGPFPTSEPEVRAIVDFISKHPNISIALLYHTYGGLLLRPYDDKSDENMETRDLWVYNALGKVGTDMTGYPNGATSKLLKYHPKEVITGTQDSWMFEDRGIFAWTVELWNIMKQAGIKTEEEIEWYRSHPHSEDLQILEWYQNHVPDGGAYVSWYPVEHPELGAVEFGGWNKLFAFRNPPYNFIKPEAEKNIQFLLALADTLPKLGLHSIEVKQLADDIFFLRIRFENCGFLPSFTSEQAKKQKALRPIRVVLEISETQELLQGKLISEVGHLEGRSNKLWVSSIGLSSSETDNRQSVEWTLRSPPEAEVRIEIQSERAGVLRTSARLSEK